MADALSGLSRLPSSLQERLTKLERLSTTPQAPRKMPLRHWRPLVDTLSLGLSFCLGTVLLQAAGATEHPLAYDLEHALPLLPLYVLSFAWYGLYKRSHNPLVPSSFADLGRLGNALAASALASLTLSALAGNWFGNLRDALLWVGLMTLPATLLVPTARAGFQAAARRLPSGSPRVVIVGSGSVATALASRLVRSACADLLGYVDDEPHGADKLPCRRLGKITDLARLCQELGADHVVIAFSRSAPSSVLEVLRELPRHVRISVVPRLFELLTWHSQVDELQGLTLMEVAPPQLDLVSRTLKRLLDIVVSASLLAAQLPLIVFVATAIKATSKGPVLFRQERVGRGGEVFRILKFRTMYVGADATKPLLRPRNEVDGPLFKLKEDPRVTKVGRFLRRTSLDEIPQLLNVLVGHMSLVGPRPFVPEESAHLDSWAARRFDVRPGMTGLWQISGRNDLPFSELRQLDYAYVASWSLWWDLKILWHTPGSVLRQRGAY